jgi:hypothetical protein
MNHHRTGASGAMDVLQVELAKLHRDANLTQSIADVDTIIGQLERARESIVAGKKGSRGWWRAIGGSERHSYPSSGEVLADFTL